MSAYAVKFTGTGNVWTVGGRTVIHDNAQEMSFLLTTPGTDPFDIIDYSASLSVLPVIELKTLDDFKDVRFPLRETDFAQDSITRAAQAQEDIARLLRDGPKRRMYFS